MESDPTKARFADRVQLATIRFQQWFARLLDTHKGQGLVEYALILALIAILVIVALKYLQPRISTTLNTVSSSL